MYKRRSSSTLGVPQVVYHADASAWLQERLSNILQVSLSFSPSIIHKAISDGSLITGRASVIVLRSCAVMFADISGFTSLTEIFSRWPDGADKLSHCLKSFFATVIAIIHSHGGEVIKFSGDAISIVFAESIGGMSRACACAVDLHRNLNGFDTGVGVNLSLHIGLGYGDIRLVNVGGYCARGAMYPRYEYLLYGQPVLQIATAVNLARPGQTVLSEEAFRVLDRTRFSVTRVSALSNYHLLGDETGQSSAQVNHPESINLSHGDVMKLRWYIPVGVYRHIDNSSLDSVNEMRVLSVVFMQCLDFDVAEDIGPSTAQQVMRLVQAACAEWDGEVNKFLTDDKGVTFMLLFGTPPVIRIDDAYRAIQACWSIRSAMSRIGKSTRFGIATGLVYCGILGSTERQEYTCIGRSVNLACRLMQSAGAGKVVTDKCTFAAVSRVVEVRHLDPIACKGITEPVQVIEIQKVTPAGQSFESPVSDLICHIDVWDTMRELRHKLEAERLQVTGGSIAISGESILTNVLCRYVINQFRQRNPSTVVIKLDTQNSIAHAKEPYIDFLNACAHALDKKPSANTQSSLPELRESTALALRVLSLYQPVIIWINMGQGSFSQRWEKIKSLLTSPATLDLFKVMVGEVRSLSSSVSMPVLVMLSSSSPITCEGINNIRVTDLSADACSEFLRILLDSSAAVPSELTAFVTDLADGNPLGIQDIALHMKAAGFVSVDGEVRVICDLKSIPVIEVVSSRVRAEVMRVVDGLDPRDAKVVKDASVFNSCFTVPDLISGPHRFIDALRILGSCNYLCRMGIFTVQENDSFMIRSPLMREVVRSTLLKRQRIIIKRKALLRRALRH